MSTPEELEALTDTLRDVRCNREPFTPEHAKCICRLTNKAADQIDSLQAQVEVLRGALDLVVQHDPTTPGLSFDSHLQLLESAVGIARAALTQSSDAEMGEKT